MQRTLSQQELLQECLTLKIMALHRSAICTRGFQGCVKDFTGKRFGGSSGLSTCSSCFDFSGMIQTTVWQSAVSQWRQRDFSTTKSGTWWVSSSLLDWSWNHRKWVRQFSYHFSKSKMSMRSQLQNFTLLSDLSFLRFRR